jgi:2-alkyl-3-oxoalkanoate reductase
VLRYGQLYGPGSPGAGQDATDRRRRRRDLLLPSRDDASTSAIAALESGAGVYNVADDEPAPAREWIPAFCAEVCAPKPWRIPTWPVRIAVGDFSARLLTEGRGASNAKAKRELSWSPSRATWRAGFLAQ